MEVRLSCFITHKPLPPPFNRISPKHTDLLRYQGSKAARKRVAIDIFWRSVSFAHSYFSCLDRLYSSWGNPLHLLRSKAIRRKWFRAQFYFPRPLFLFLPLTYGDFPSIQPWRFLLFLPFTCFSSIVLSSAREKRRKACWEISLGPTLLFAWYLL